MAFDAGGSVRRFGVEYSYQEKNISADLAKSRPMSPKAQLEEEKRMRREIANSNERRRMQCINAGFQGLRALIPELGGEKLSKAAILQHTTEYIAKLLEERKQVQNQNDQLKRMLNKFGSELDADLHNVASPLKKKKRDSDEGISMGDSTSDGSTDLPTVGKLHQEIISLRQQFNQEHMHRVMIEERARSLETQLMHHAQTLHHIPLITAHSHLPSSPINLKMEPHQKKTACNVQEVSAHEERKQSERVCNPAPGRNLYNLVEAIRQIEGDRVLCDDSKCKSEDQHTTLNSEESEKESSISDPDECKSESSGRDSPLALYSRRLIYPPAPQAAHQGLVSEKIPMSAPVLHHSMYSPYYRPGVIVHKS